VTVHEFNPKPKVEISKVEISKVFNNIIVKGFQ